MPGWHVPLPDSGFRSPECECGLGQQHAAWRWAEKTGGTPIGTTLAPHGHMLIKCVCRLWAARAQFATRKGASSACPVDFGSTRQRRTGHQNIAGAGCHSSPFSRSKERLP